MERIGIRALQQHASAVLRRVRHGECVEVTDRGRPVALLVPVGHETVLAALEAAGRLTPAEGDLVDLGPPLAGKVGAPTATEQLARARRHER